MRVVVFSCSESEIKFINGRFPNLIGEGKVNFSIGKCFKALKRELKKEISDYYVTIFSRKAGAPICITLCILTIVSYAVSHF